jgi:hypothetical protein
MPFAKMLLNALGITGTYTGNGWEINVATAAQKMPAVLTALTAPLS